MKWFVGSALFVALLSAGFGQQTYPPIDRSIEMHRKSIRSKNEVDQTGLQQSYNKAREAAAQMVVVAGELRKLQDQPFSASAEDKSFRDAVKRRCRKIRDLTKPIQEVSFLDPGESERSDSWDRAKDRDELTVLVDQLSSLAESIRVRLDSLAGHGVAIRELESPSLDSLIESAKRLSKTVEKSAAKL
jgi:hypothetical protein